MDITREKEVLEKLQENAERMALAEKAASFGIWEMDLVTGMVKGSEAWAALERVEGKLWWSNIVVGILPGPFTMSDARRVYEAMVPLYASPVFRERLALQTMAVWPATAQQLAATLAEERKRFELLVKATGFQKEDA